MNEAQPDPNNAEFLASQDQDQPLPAPQRAALNAALAQSDGLRAFAANLKRIQAWLDSWGRATGDLDVDLDSFVGHVHDRIATSPEEEDDLRTIDDWLSRVVSAPDAIDSDRFVGDVMRRVAPAPRRRVASLLLFRLGVPLAAAAAIVFALIGPFGSGKGGRPGTVDRQGTGDLDERIVASAECIVEIGTTARTLADREEAVLIAFARKTVSVAIPHESESSVSFVSFGASVGAIADQPPPL